MDIVFDITKVSLTDIDNVRPNTWNPKNENTEEYRKVKQSIETNGQLLPVFVRENDGYEIIDGQQKWTACKELNYKQIAIYNFGEISDQEAQQLTIWFQQQVPFDQIDLSYLVAELHEKYENIQLPYNQQEIEEMLNLAKFNFDQYQNEQPDTQNQDDEVRTLSLTMARDKYEMICGVIDAVIAQEGLHEKDQSRALELICANYASGM